jgi:mannitol/fructose-specific phosphotransferase system IIA component (Ntr-type)
MNNLSGVHFSSLFSEEHVICHTDKTDRNEVLMELLKHMAYQVGIGNVDVAMRGLLEREDTTPSLVEKYPMAIPHARLQALKEVVVGIATSREGFSYTSDGRILLR